MIILNNQYVNDLNLRMNALEQQLREMAEQPTSETKRYIALSTTKTGFKQLLIQKPRIAAHKISTSPAHTVNLMSTRLLDLISNALA